ncbi:MAG: MFS transporter [Dehalococcoidia bacterium]
MTLKSQDAASPVEAPAAGHPATVVRPTTGRFKTFASLRHRDYRLLWVGTVVMSTGQWLQQVVLSWIVFEMTGSAFMLGLINGVRFLPFLFTSLIGGVLADRVDRRRLMLWTQWYIFAVTLIMGLLFLADRVAVWHLFVFTFVSGAGWSLTMPVRQSIVPALVPRSELLNAVALSSAAFNITRTVGPAIGGFLLAAIGGGGTFLVQAALYLVVVAMLAAMRVPPIAAPPGGRTLSAWGSMVEGFRYIRATPVVGMLLVLGLVPMLLGMPYQTLLPIFAADIYDIGPGGLGILIGFAGLGSFLATLAVASAGDFQRKGLMQLLSLGALGVTLVLYSQIAWLPLALLVLIGVGAAQMGYSTLNQTQLQTITTDAMRGRVQSVYMLNVGLVPAGSFAAGAIAALIGAPATVAIMGVLIAAVALLALVRVKSMREL